MAVRFCSAPSLITQNYMPIKKPVHKILKVTHSQIPVQKTSPPQMITSSSIRIKIFEDQSRGIVCYKDDSGEITCEGYDEGPRPTSSYRPRDAEITDLLLRNWHQLVEGGGKGFN
ncbi:hypothetical protein RHSIM_Rhsim08G0244400 [Rhododendron simsii]|uniref:Uncharacterized protein n=1 Tax=Rhododendron simsii TaxID=118357 RepID=A0A834GM57_RHOSS|nr:hypothetical protein RHSIM_Rhsim08G0244400 [Rhododendron simsii]